MPGRRVPRFVRSVRASSSRFFAVGARVAAYGTQLVLQEREPGACQSCRHAMPRACCTHPWTASGCRRSGNGGPGEVCSPGGVRGRAPKTFCACCQRREPASGRREGGALVQFAGDGVESFAEIHAFPGGVAIIGCRVGVDDDEFATLAHGDAGQGGCRVDGQA